MFDYGAIVKSQFLNEEIAGPCLYIWPNGNTNKGIVKNHKRNSLNYFKWPNGNKYCGLYKDDKPDRIGTKYLKDGRLYKG